MKHLLAFLLALSQPHHPIMKISQYCGDSRTHAIALAWDGAAFTPGTDWNLIWTAKKSASDDDAHAAIQKTSGAGITVTGSEAYVELVPFDTAAMATGDLVWDIQAVNVSSGAVRTVAEGRLTLRRDITRGTATSIPVYTANPPIALGEPVTADAIAAALGFQNTSDMLVPYGPLTLESAPESAGLDIDLVRDVMNGGNRVPLFYAGTGIHGAVYSTDLLQLQNGTPSTVARAGQAVMYYDGVRVVLNGWNSSGQLILHRQSFPMSGMPVLWDISWDGEARVGGTTDPWIEDCGRAGKIAQHCYEQLGGDDFNVWECVRESPVKWIKIHEGSAMQGS